MLLFNPVNDQVLAVPEFTGQVRIPLGTGFSLLCPAFWSAPQVGGGADRYDCATQHPTLRGAPPLRVSGAHEAACESLSGRARLGQVTAALWDTVDPNVFVLADGRHFHVYVYVPVAINGAMVNHIGTTIQHPG